MTHVPNPPARKAVLYQLLPVKSGEVVLVEMQGGAP